MRNTVYIVNITVACALAFAVWYGIEIPRHAVILMTMYVAGALVGASIAAIENNARGRLPTASNVGAKEADDKAGYCGLCGGYDDGKSHECRYSG